MAFGIDPSLLSWANSDSNLVTTHLNGSGIRVRVRVRVGRRGRVIVRVRGRASAWE